MPGIWVGLWDLLFFFQGVQTMWQIVPTSSLRIGQGILRANRSGSPLVDVKHWNLLIWDLSSGGASPFWRVHKKATPISAFKNVCSIEYPYSETSSLGLFLQNHSEAKGFLLSGQHPLSPSGPAAQRTTRPHQQRLHQAPKEITSEPEAWGRT